MKPYPEVQKSLPANPIRHRVRRGAVGDVLEEANAVEPEEEVGVADGDLDCAKECGGVGEGPGEFA